jgi:hypothetical protein
MIIDFLPNPNEQKHFNNIDDESVKSCGIVFKVLKVKFVLCSLGLNEDFYAKTLTKNSKIS